MDYVVHSTRSRIGLSSPHLLAFSHNGGTRTHPQRAKGRATRERIMQAAAELIVEKGVAGMSLDDVRARTGASRSQLYHYFEDRDRPYRAVVDATTDAVLGRQDEFLEHLDSWAAVDRWFDFMVHHQVARQARGGCPIGSLAGQLAEA